MWQWLLVQILWHLLYVFSRFYSLKNCYANGICHLLVSGVGVKFASDKLYESDGCHCKHTMSSMGFCLLQSNLGSHPLRCHFTESNPFDDHSNISSNMLQKQNFKPLDHYTSMQCSTSHLQTVQENILSHTILATYRTFTVVTVRFTQNVSCNIYTHPRYQQVANITV